MQRINLRALGTPVLAGAAVLAFFRYALGYSWQASLLRGGVVICATLLVVGIRRASQRDL